MVELIANVNNAINGFVWGVPMLVLLVGTGILMTILTKFFQLSHIGHWFKNTVGGISLSACYHFGNRQNQWVKMTH